LWLSGNQRGGQHVRDWVPVQVPGLANYVFSIDLWKEIVEWRLGTLPSVGSARSVGQCTQHFLFIHYGDKAICPLHASVGSTNDTSLRPW
jgi:hypothetical protein